MHKTNVANIATNNTANGSVGHRLVKIALNIILQIFFNFQNNENIEASMQLFLS